jgi:hypothetical protein
MYTDDIDGTDVGTNAKPFTFTVGRQGYSIYLTDENREKLLATLKPYTDRAKKVKAPTGIPAPEAAQGDGNGPALPRGAKSEFAKAKSDQMAALRKWAKRKKITLAARGGPTNEVYAQFFAEHEDQPKYIGREAMTIEEYVSSKADEQGDAE